MVDLECKISVIIPTFKPKEYIFDCLNSILANNLEQIEVLIIYNGEKNDLYPKIVDFCTKNSNVRLIYTEKAGVSNARNIGILQSKGQYISFIDDDDWVSENYFKGLLEKAEDNTIVSSNVVCYNNETREYYLWYIGNNFKKLKGKIYSLFAFRSFFSTVCCKLIPKKCIENIRFDESLKLSEDSLFMFELSKNIKNVVLTNDDVIYYRRVSNLLSKKNDLQQRLLVLKKYIIVYLKNPLKYNFLFFISRVVAVCYHHIFRLIIK